VSTVADWLESREPAPPAALRERLSAALGGHLHQDARETADVCLTAGERLLEVVLGSEDANRDCALDLLAADALVTYAFEAASSEPDDLPDWASRAMARIASLGMLSAR
jgi:hypothetical protein